MLVLLIADFPFSGASVWMDIFVTPNISVNVTFFYHTEKSTVLDEKVIGCLCCFRYWAEKNHSKKTEIQKYHIL